MDGYERGLNPQVEEVLMSEVKKTRLGGVVIVSLPRGDKLDNYIDGTNFKYIASKIGLTNEAFVYPYSREISNKRIYIVDKR